MKFPVFSIAIVAGLLSTIILPSQTDRESGAPFTEPVDQDLPRSVRVHAEFIEIPLATYTKLTSNSRESSNDTDLREQCAQLIESGEAQMLEALCVNALPAQTAASESLTEFIYPTERGPLELPNKIAAGARSPSPPIDWPSIPPVWTAFETKMTGPILEVEASLDEDHPFVDLRFTPTLVAFSKKIRWATWRLSQSSFHFDLPMFYVLSVKTGITVMPGQPMFVAALSPRNEEGFMESSRKVMVFFRADVLSLKK
jgi:hypothetical protein